MTVSDPCDFVLLVQADLDRELDPMQAASIDAHRAECPTCQAAYEEMRLGRQAFRAGLDRYLASDVLRRRLAETIDAIAPTPSSWKTATSRLTGWWRVATGFGLGAAMTGAFALWLLLPADNNLPDEIVAAHIRALQPGHLVDVASNNQHNVRPWFDGRVDFAPPVKNLSDQGFPLEGGRLDYIGGRPVAALAYRRNKHIVELFIWPRPTEMDRSQIMTERNGYRLVSWTEDHMALWVATDLNQTELDEFLEIWHRAK